MYCTLTISLLCIKIHLQCMTRIIDLPLHLPSQIDSPSIHILHGHSLDHQRVCHMRELE